MNKSEILAMALLSGGLALSTMDTEAVFISEDVDEAHRLCMVLKSAEIAIECTVIVKKYTIDATVHTDPASAKNICDATVQVMEKRGKTFAGKWTLKIFSPYSGERPIATCVLM